MAIIFTQIKFFANNLNSLLIIFKEKNKKINQYNEINYKMRKILRCKVRLFNEKDRLQPAILAKEAIIGT